MTTVFMSGSRQVLHLPDRAKERLNNVINSGFNVIVGDANGADKAIQAYLQIYSYTNVTVFCSGETCRNNLGRWNTRNIGTNGVVKGFQFYAMKDREMAREADYGFMIWDGKSAGTLLNILRLVRAGKIAVLLNMPQNKAETFKTSTEWDSFLVQCSTELQDDLRKRATPEEWRPSKASTQATFFDPVKLELPPLGNLEVQPKTEATLIHDLNTALAAADLKAMVDALGLLIQARGVSRVAKDAGLSRSSVNLAIKADGKPKFETLLKIIDATGLQLSADRRS